MTQGLPSESGRGGEGGGGTGAALLDQPRPIVELLRIAVPTVAQMASYTVMQFLDTWMLSHVGDRLTAPTAASNSGILAFAVISMGMGVLWVVNTLVSQSYGRRDYRACGQFLWQGVWFSLAFAALVLPLLPLAPRAFLLLGHEPGLAREEAVYLQILVSFGAVKLVGTTFGQFLLAIDRAKYVMVSTFAGVAANALAAWVLIFHYSLGVTGAAWAQNVGVAVETLLAIGLTMLPSIRRTFHSLDFKYRAAQMRTLLQVGLPSGFQIFADVFAWGVWGNLVFSFFGTTGMAANNYVFRYMAVSFMPAFGISTAVTALVGRYIGRGRPDIAVARAHLGFAVALGYMVCCAVLFLLARRQLIGLFTVDPDVLRIGATLLVFAAAYQLFDAVYIVYYGALRGAGDTFVPAMATALLCWSITVLGGYLVARHVPDLGPRGPWMVAMGYGLVLGSFMFARFTRGGWRRIDLGAGTYKGEPASHTVAPAAGATGASPVPAEA
ncbi:MAG TPA: MATE family efflux transporter [Tepidisphaeraceae bacterium]|nr:MATE family efflux transporter [Tepidisphaeraceae bacterium]